MNKTTSPQSEEQLRADARLRISLENAFGSIANVTVIESDEDRKNLVDAIHRLETAHSMIAEGPVAHTLAHMIEVLIYRHFLSAAMIADLELRARVQHFIDLNEAVAREDEARERGEIV